MISHSLFCFGSRQIIGLPKPVTEYLEACISDGFHFLVGDANGADKQFQKFLSSREVKQVTVFTSLENPRNNFGDWEVNRVIAYSKLRGHEMHQAKDVVAANMATAGICLWDGESVGSLLSALLILKHEGTVKIWMHDGSQRFIDIPNSDRFYEFVHGVNSESLAKAIGRFNKLSEASRSGQQESLFESPF